MNNFFNYDKVIYQSYECEYSDLHPKYKETSSTWINMHPDWKYHFASAEQRREEVMSELNLSKYGIDAYDDYGGITQSDFWRFIMTGKHSGMWADLDSVAVQSVDLLIDTLDRKVEVIVPEEGYQIGVKGSNCSNFVFAKDTFLGNEIVKLIYEHLEINGFLKHKLYQKPTLFDTMQIWPSLIDMHRDKAAQIYNTEYYVHSEEYKPNTIYRGEVETQNKISRCDRIGIYTPRWENLYNRAKESLS